LLIKLSELKETEPKREHGDIESLKKSIMEIGLLNPLTINQENKLLAGRRRFQAIKELGWEQVECIMLTSENILFDFKVAIEENLRRKPLTDPENAIAISEYDKLKREIEGSQPQGKHSSLSQNDNDGWSQQKTADDLGVSHTSVVYAIQIAKAVEEKPELAKLKGTQILREIKLIKQREEIKTLKPIEGKYRVIYADCPWNYNDKRDGHTTGAEDHYPCMSIEELCNLPIKELSEDNAVLFFWVTSPLLEECFEVINTWGFKYKTSFVWDKVKHNMGHYNSVRHELLLICTKGNCLPDSKKLIDSVQSIERSDIHSEKPEEFRKIIDTLYPVGKRIELFARKQIEGWESWGTDDLL